MDSHCRMGDRVQTLFHLLIMAHIIALFKSMGHVLISSVSTRYRLENQTSVHVWGTVSAQWLWISMDSHVCVHIYDMYLYIYILYIDLYIWLDWPFIVPFQKLLLCPSHPSRDLIHMFHSARFAATSLVERLFFWASMMCFKLCAPQYEAIVLRQGWWSLCDDILVHPKCSCIGIHII